MDMALLAQLDFILRKLHFPTSTAAQPNFNDKGYINIKDGRHPLLDQKKQYLSMYGLEKTLTC